jgi:hypothetical protein
MQEFPIYNDQAMKLERLTGAVDVPAEYPSSDRHAGRCLMIAGGARHDDDGVLRGAGRG